MKPENDEAAKIDGECQEPGLRGDLENCPRCGEPIACIVWGQTNCPRCGLHFECC